MLFVLLFWSEILGLSVEESLWLVPYMLCVAGLEHEIEKKYSCLAFCGGRGWFWTPAPYQKQDKTKHKNITKQRQKKIKTNKLPCKITKKRLEKSSSYSDWTFRMESAVSQNKIKEKKSNI